jgi:hypothetical protein
MFDDRSESHSEEPFEVVIEAIDRNRQKGWKEYRKTFDFTLLDDGTVQISSKDQREREHLVKLMGGKAVACDCYIYQNPYKIMTCRHMRAADAHPQL